MDPAQVEKELRSKPSLETVRDQYRALVRQLADQIAALTPGTTWSLDEDTWVGCGGIYGKTNARQAYLMAVFSGPIPESAWPQAFRLVEDAAAKLGATNHGTFQNRSANHDVAFSGTNRVVFQLATQKASTLVARTDCRLNQADMEPK